MNSNCYESTSEEKPDKIGQKEFENLYGPLVEHMYFWRPTNCYLGEVPCYLDPAATIEEERKRLAILSIFKKRSEDEFDALWQKQKDGTILDKEELGRKKDAWMALVYVERQIQRRPGGGSRNGHLADGRKRCRVRPALG